MKAVLKRSTPGSRLWKARKKGMMVYFVECLYFSVEARAETVRSRAGIWIHLEKSIVDFLIREGVIKCSELGQGLRGLG